MNEKIAKQSPVYITLTMIIVLAVIITSIILANNESTIFNAHDNIVELTSADISGIGEVSIPDHTSMDKGEELVFRFRLPEDLKDGDALMYSSNYCSGKIYVGDTLVKSYGETLPLPYGSMVGNIRVLVPLTAADSGKILAIDETSLFKGVQRMNHVYVGSQSELEFFVLRHNIWRIIICMFLLTIMLICVFLSFYHAILKRKNMAATYGCLSGFIICIVVWLICSSDIPQFFTNHNELVSFVSFLALAFMGPVFMAFCFRSLPKGQKAMFIVSNLGLLLPVVNAITFVLNICNPVDLMYATHIYLAGCIILTIVNSIRSWRSKLETRFLVVAVVCLAVAAGVSLIFFYQDQIGVIPAIILSIGLCMFVLFLFIMLLVKEQRMITEFTSDDVYMKMAFMDYLTGCGNRAAFERELEQCATNEAKRVTLIMFDLNRLKVTNDELGHSAGDEMILGITECISKTFIPDGKCYRLGGDEFATVLWDCEDKLDFYFEKLKNQIEFYNSEHVITLSVAYGCYSADNPKELQGFTHIYTMADKNMYLDKARCHKEMDGEA